MLYILIFFFFFKQKTAYELRISDWSSDVCSSDLILRAFDIGHDSETRMAEYMRLAGFTMLTERPDGQQFGFGIAPHPETGRSRVAGHIDRSEEHTSELQSLMRISYAVFCLKKKINSESATRVFYALCFSQSVYPTYTH